LRVHVPTNTIGKISDRLRMPFDCLLERFILIQGCEIQDDMLRLRVQYENYALPSLPLGRDTTLKRLRDP